MKKIASVILAIVLVMGFSFCHAEELTVSGSGSVVAKPDYVSVSLGVSASAETVLAAQQAVNETIALVKEAIMEGGVAEDDITTDSISIYTMYDYTTDIETVAGYNASHILTVCVYDIAGAGAIMDAALCAGANSVYSVYFGIKDETKYYNQAMQLAVSAAQDKAQMLAQAAGVTLGKIESVTEADYGNGYYNYTNTLVSAAAEEAATSLSTGTMTITANVTIAYEIKD